MDILHGPRGPLNLYQRAAMGIAAGGLAVVALMGCSDTGPSSIETPTLSTPTIGGGETYTPPVQPGNGGYTETTLYNGGGAGNWTPGSTEAPLYGTDEGYGTTDTTFPVPTTETPYTRPTYPETTRTTHCSEDFRANCDGDLYQNGEEDYPTRNNPFEDPGNDADPYND